jgi:regulation of enolase protein 1 (concanavalin A-like superfamily)
LLVPRYTIVHITCALSKIYKYIFHIHFFHVYFMSFITNFKALSILQTLLILVTLAIMSNATTTTTIPPFNLSAPTGTDIWRKPPSHDAFNAPTHPSELPTYDLKSFQRARLTFALPPASQLRQYDQAGLLLHFTKPGVPANQTKWVKTGIEFYYGKPYVATVGCDTWADWSLTPDPSFTSNDTRPSATIEARREKDALGKSLWVYWIVKDGNGKEIERRPLREVNWAFAEEEGWSVGVGGYVCRPTKEGGEELLEAEFGEGVEIELLDPSK